LSSGSYAGIAAHQCSFQGGSHSDVPPWNRDVDIIEGIQDFLTFIYDSQDKLSKKIGLMIEELEGAEIQDMM